VSYAVSINVQSSNIIFQEKTPIQPFSRRDIHGTLISDDRKLKGIYSGVETAVFSGEESNYG